MSLIPVFWGSVEITELAKGMRFEAGFKQPADGRPYMLVLHCRGQPIQAKLGIWSTVRGQFRVVVSIAQADGNALYTVRPCLVPPNLYFSVGRPKRLFYPDQILKPLWDIKLIVA